jgi:hypothetical protein
VRSSSVNEPQLVARAGQRAAPELKLDGWLLAPRQAVVAVCIGKSPALKLRRLK